MSIIASVEWEECLGNGICARVAPEIFALDEQGMATVILGEIPEALFAKATLAMRQCPTQAISVGQLADEEHPPT